MINIQLDTRKIQEELKKLPETISNDRILNGIADIVVRGIQGRSGVFDNEGIQGDNEIKSVLWQKSKAAQKEKRKTLNQSKHLRKSIHRNNAKDGEVSVGTTAVYGAIHQFGGKAGRNKSVTLPPRPFLAIDKNTQERILTFIQKQFKKS